MAAEQSGQPRDERPTAFSIAALLPADMHDAIAAWSESVHGASTDPVASHVTILVFESGHTAEDVRRAIADACVHFEPFEVHLSQIVQGPYWGKENLDIVMLTADPGQPGIAGLMGLRELLLRYLAPLVAQPPQLPAEAEYQPHLTLTTGLPPQEATRLAHQAEGMSATFEVHDLAVWQQPEHRENAPWDLIGMVPLGAGQGEIEA